MFDSNGKRIDFALKSKKDIQEDFIDSYYADSVAPEILNKIKRFEAMPCYKRADSTPLEGDEWEKHMVPITYVGGDQNYFIATSEQIFQTT